MIKKDDFLNGEKDFISRENDFENKTVNNIKDVMYNTNYDSSGKSCYKEVNNDINYQRLNKSIKLRKKIDKYLTIFVYVVVIIMMIIFIRYFNIIV